MADARTSVTHPIEVAWLPLPWPGKVGLTFAPGKKDPAAATGAWARDLAADLQRLKTVYETAILVSLIEDHELDLLQIQQLPEAAAAAGIALRRFPIADVSVPADASLVSALVAEIGGYARAGKNLVIHCRGGLGRTGTIGGCVLRSAGFDGEAALAALRAARGVHCPETREQREFILTFPAGPSLADRCAGAVLGAAIGDALGHPTEFYSFRELEKKYGAGGVKGFELWWHEDGKESAPYTDDTQLAEIVLRALLDEGADEESFEAAMQKMANGFAYWKDYPQGGHRAPGNACLAGAARLQSGTAWRKAGGPDAGGCGSVMRAYPFGLLLHTDPERAERWAVEHSRMTHQAPIALAACAAMAAGMASELSGNDPARTFELMVAAASRYDAATAALCAGALDDAVQGTDPVDVLTRLEGWAADEAIAAAMFVVARHPQDIRAALLEGANASGDSDSIATLAGALLGARLGLQALPPEWVRDVERSEVLLGLAGRASELISA